MHEKCTSKKVLFSIFYTFTTVNIALKKQNWYGWKGDVSSNQKTTASSLEDQKQKCESTITKEMVLIEGQDWEDIETLSRKSRQVEDLTNESTIVMKSSKLKRDIQTIDYYFSRYQNKWQKCQKG